MREVSPRSSTPMSFVQRKSGLLLSVALVCGLLAVAARAPRGIQHYREKRREVEILEQRNATLAAENRYRAQRIQRLQHDRQAQELVIRERLKKINPGEVQFVDGDPGDKAEAPSAPSSAAPSR